jgi:hypothetical protein
MNKESKSVNMKVEWGEFNQKHFLSLLGFEKSEIEGDNLYKHEHSPIHFAIVPNVDKKDTIKQIFEILIKIGRQIKSQEIQNALMS